MDGMERSAAPGRANEADRAAVARGFEALLFAEILRPVAKDFGAFGELALGAAARQAFDPQPRERP